MNIVKIIAIIAFLTFIFSIVFVYNANASLTPSTGWAYYKQIDITDTGNVSADYQMKLTVYAGSGTDDPANGIVYCNNHCSNFPNDIRFGTTNDPSTATQLAQWIEESNATFATIWVKLPSDGSNTIYMFVGNSSAGKYSSGDDTFILFDDFEGTSLDTDKWEVLNVNYTVSDSAVHFSDASNNNNAGLYSKNYTHPASGVIIEWRGRVTSTAGATRGVGSRGDTNYLYKGCGGLGYYMTSTKGIKVFNYAGTSSITSATVNLNTWYRMRTELQPNKIKAIRLDDDVSAEISNTLASHEISVYAYNWDLDFIAVRKYSSTEPSWSSFGSWTSTGANNEPSLSISLSDNQTVDIEQDLNITVSDADGDTMNIAVKVDNQTYTTFENISNGTYKIRLYFKNYNYSYNVNVSVTDDYATNYSSATVTTNTSYKRGLSREEADNLFLSSALSLSSNLLYLTVAFALIVVSFQSKRVILASVGTMGATFIFLYLLYLTLDILYFICMMVSFTFFLYFAFSLLGGHKYE